MVSPQITNLIIILGMMQVGKKIPFDDPTVMNGVRALYVLSNVLIVSIFFYIQTKINANRDKTMVKYVEPAPMGSSEEGKPVTTTVQAYDSEQVRGQFKTQMMGVAMMAFMHLYLKYTNPLLVQSIIPFKGALESNLFKVYILGKPAVGDLKRPWKTTGPMGMGGSEPKTDKKSIENAERSGRGGAKEE